MAESNHAEKFVGVTEATAISISALNRAELNASHVRWKDPDYGLHTRTDRGDGYVVFLLRRDLEGHPAWTDGRPTPHATVQQGKFLLLDMREEHTALVRGEVDCVSIYTPSDALRRFREEHDLPATGLLHTPHGVIHDDVVIRNLGEALMPAIMQPHEASQFYVEHVSMALLARLTAHYAADPLPFIQLRGALAPWQERRAREIMMANLDGKIGLHDLAAECRLSRSHFARAFKTSTGMSPLRWLSGQRIKQAKTLLMTTKQPIEQIAAACGFSDASHLTRSFQRATGVPPGIWRRMRQ